MRVSDSVGCVDFPCTDVRHAAYWMPGVEVDAASVRAVMIAEAAAAEPGDNLYAAGDALFERTAKLPKVDFREPKKLIGTNTTSSIQAGLYYGSLGLIDGILERLLQQMGDGTKAIATGGQAALITQGSRYLKAADEDLTLEGLQLIYQRNRPQ